MGVVVEGGVGRGVVIDSSSCCLFSSSIVCGGVGGSESWWNVGVSSVEFKGGFSEMLLKTFWTMFLVGSSICNKFWCTT